MEEPAGRRARHRRVAGVSAARLLLSSLCRYKMVEVRFYPRVKRMRFTLDLIFFGSYP
jgi:hypothetical protein